MPYTFHTEPDSGYNQAIEWEQAFNSADTQIEVYPAVPPGGYDIIRRKADKGTAVSEPVYLLLCPRLGCFFFLGRLIGCSSLPLPGSGVRIPNTEDNPKSDWLFSFLLS